MRLSAARFVACAAGATIVEADAEHGLLVGLGRGTVDERMAVVLLDFKAPLALSGAIPEDACEYHLPMTEQQMADHLGNAAAATVR